MKSKYIVKKIIVSLPPKKNGHIIYINIRILTLTNIR